MNKEFAWLLGYLLSDGSIVKPTYRKKGNETHLSFICKYSDREILEKVKIILNTTANILDYPYYKSPQSKINIYDRNDIIENFSDIKCKVPEHDIAGYERHFIRGCFDGDGTLSYRQNRNSFRIGFIDQKYNITQWVSKTICNNLLLPDKEPRFVKQSNVWEILWEGNIARLIAFWLYHGDISNCCLQRKLDKYKKAVLNDFIPQNINLEILKACNAFIDDNNEISFNIPGLKTLEWCKRIQKQLTFNSIPVFHNKGKRKYYHLYIPNNQIANMRDKFNES